MANDALAPSGARASVAIALTLRNGDNFVFLENEWTVHLWCFSVNEWYAKKKTKVNDLRFLVQICCQRHVFRQFEFLCFLLADVRIWLANVRQSIRGLQARFIEKSAVQLSLLCTYIVWCAICVIGGKLCAACRPGGSAHSLTLTFDLPGLWQWPTKCSAAGSWPWPSSWSGIRLWPWPPRYWVTIIMCQLISCWDMTLTLQ